MSEMKNTTYSSEEFDVTDLHPSAAHLAGVTALRAVNLTEEASAEELARIRANIKAWEVPVLEHGVTCWTNK